MNYIVNIVEDEINLNNILKVYLEKEGYRVCSYFTGEEALKGIQAGIDMWIIDIMLPDINGYTLLKKIKELTPEVFTVFISARNQDIDRVVGLEMGCDDYISKPFLPRELIIRVEKLFQNAQSRSDKDILIISGYTICRYKRKILLKNTEIELSTKEFDLLLFLIQNFDKAFSREQILTSVWGYDYFGSSRVVDDTIRRIRKKLPLMGIETLYGFGYRLRNGVEI